MKSSSSLTDHLLDLVDTSGQLKNKMVEEEDAGSQIVPCSEVNSRDVSVGPENPEQNTQKESSKPPVSHVNNSPSAEGSTSKEIIVISSDEVEEIRQPQKKRRVVGKHGNKNKKLANVSLA